MVNKTTSKFRKFFEDHQKHLEQQYKEAEKFTPRPRVEQ